MIKKMTFRIWDPSRYFALIIKYRLPNRLKTTLQYTISEEQACGIPNRTIFSDLFTIRELIAHITKKSIKSYIVSVDQEKAFDNFYIK